MKVRGWDRALEQGGTNMLARGCDGLIEEDVADMASKLVEKFLVKLLEEWIGRRSGGGNRTEMRQEVRLVDVALFTALARTVGRVVVVIHVVVEGAVYEDDDFIENDI